MAILHIRSGRRDDRNDRDRSKDMHRDRETEGERIERARERNRGGR